MLISFSGSSSLINMHKTSINASLIISAASTSFVVNTYAAVCGKNIQPSAGSFHDMHSTREITACICSVVTSVLELVV